MAFWLRRLLRTVPLIVFGLFCIIVPRALLTKDNLPFRYKDMDVLGTVFFYVGVILLFISFLIIISIFFRAWRSSRTSHT